MFAIIGIVLVFAAVIGGFLMEKGHIAVLIQPAELLIIVGAATGTLLVANPVRILKAIAGGLLRRSRARRSPRQRYLNTLKMMYQFLNKVRKEGPADRGNGRGETRGERDLQELSRVSQ